MILYYSLIHPTNTWLYKMKQMNETNQVQDDEIDLFEFFETLWDGKWLISAFVATAVLLGGSFLLSKDTEYKSKLIYSVDTIPPFYKADKVSSDFQKKFYSASIFEEWKQNNSNISIVFEDFSATEVVDGFLLSKDEDQLLATFETNKKYHSFLLVKSNQLPILDGFFKYFIHINGMLQDEYVARAKEELKMIESRFIFKDLSSAQSDIVDTVLSIDRYIVTAEKGAFVLAIQRPTMPQKISFNRSILVMSVLLGGMIGVIFILVRNAVKKRKKQLAKA
jgi:hypothetical protein